MAGYQKINKNVSPEIITADYKSVKAQKTMSYGRFLQRMAKTVLLSLPLILLFYALLVYDRNTRIPDKKSRSLEMVVEFRNRLDEEPIEMPTEVWSTPVTSYGKFPEIVNLLEQHYVPTCQAKCQGYSTELVNLIRQGECLHLWPYVYVLDSETDIYTENNSTASLPCFLSLRTSIIKNAGRGIFTDIHLPAGMLFGPYKGYIVHNESEISAYAWQIFYEDSSTNYFYVDGGHPKSSNWMRYVNTARYEEEQNVFAFPANEAIYYMTYKRIPANTELLTWYGPNYAKVLGMKFKKGRDEVWPLIAPSKRDYKVSPTDVPNDENDEN